MNRKEVKVFDAYDAYKELDRLNNGGYRGSEIKPNNHYF